MAEFSLAAAPRTDFGKGAARRVRRAGQVPVVLYGHGEDPQHYSVPGHELMLALRRGGLNALIRLEVEGGQTRLALTRAVQRDPIKGFFEHVDLLTVIRGEKVTVDIPLHIVGDTAPDTLPDVQMNSLSVEAEATHVPDGIDVDVTGMGGGESILASQVRLPEGATLAADPDQLVLSIVGTPTAAELDAELADAEAEVGIVHDATDAEVADAEAQAAAEGGAGDGGAGQADAAGATETVGS